MTTDAELVALLVRVDWTGLSLSAKVSWRRDSAALLREVTRVRAARRGVTPPRPSRPHAPGFEETVSMLILGRGGRYRHEQARRRGERVTVADCDGVTSWEQDYDPVSGASQTSIWDYVRPLGSLSPLSELLRPSWLPAGFQLEVIGPATACGRDAVEFAGRPRPLVMSEPIGDRVVAIADLQLGIVLRCERLSGEDLLMVMELTELRVNPPESADPAAFTPREAADPGLISRIPAQIVRQAAKTSTSVTMTALAAGVRCLSAPLTAISGAGGTMPAAPRPQPATSGQIMSVPGHVLDKGTYRADQVLAAGGGQYKVDTIVPPAAARALRDRV